MARKGWWFSVAFLFGCENVHLEYPTKVIFESLSLGVNAGERIGVVGRNGDGKSSLLGLFDGRVEPDEGRIVRTNGVQMATLAQFDELDESKTIMENVVGSVPEYVWASDARTRRVIEGLLSDLDASMPVASLSGGQRRRVDLARVLVADADVLLLDEPTNHLDVGAISWLAGFLRTRFAKGDGALVLVTHDRWFLDEVCQSMWEVHGGIVEPFEGGYSAYIEQRVERDRQIQKAEAKRRNLARRELAWLSRGARARSTKPKFHVEAARELIAQEPPIRNSVELKRAAVSRLGKRCVDVKGVTFSYEAPAASAISAAPVASSSAGASDSPAVPTALAASNHPVIDDVTWLIGPGDRYGLLGANGAGKSTLLDLVQGKLMPQKGYVTIGKTVKFAYLSQRLTELDEFKGDRVRDVLKHYQSHYEVEGKIVSPAQLLEQLGFEKAHLNSMVDALSGGQRRRLQLMLILLDAPNVLILDEPSNDMDTDMLVAMENVLDKWPGTLILVTHDRYLMERVTDNQFALIGGSLRHVPRGVEEYLELLSEYEASQQRGSAVERLRGICGSQQERDALTSDGSKGHGKASNSSSGVPAGLTAAQANELRKQVRSLERKMHTAEGKVEQAQQRLAQADPYDYEGLLRIQQEIDQLKAAKAKLEDEWLETSMRLEGC